MIRRSTHRRASATGGFTLIELIIVVAVIGVIVGMALNNYFTAQVRAKVAATQSNLSTLVRANQTYFLDNGVYIANPGEIDRLPSQYFLKYTDGGYRDLTSPIAYISRPVLDPFQYRRVPLVDETEMEAAERAGMLYSWHYGTDPERKIAFVFESVGPDGDLDFPFAALDDSNPSRPQGLPNGEQVSGEAGMQSLAWYFQLGYLKNLEEARKLYIHGKPDVLTDLETKRAFLCRIYDPTNGARSDGDIPAMPH